MDNIWLPIVSGLLILIGLAGTILPLLPGTPVSLFGLLLYGYFTDWERVTVIGAVVFSVLTLITLILDFVTPALAAKGYKASSYGSWGAIIGAFLGIFTLVPVGAIFGPFIGGFIGEYLHAANTEKALRIAWASFLGFLIGTIFK